MNSVEERLAAVRTHIDSICRECGRNPEEVRLIAVSKTKPASLVRQAVEAGQADIGESYVQEFLDKSADPELRDLEVNWHFIGHLQSNKIKYIIDRVCMVHSIDKLSTAKELSKRARAKELTVDYLLEINTSGESTKFGISPQELLDTAPSFFDLPSIRLRGLMTIASPDPRKAPGEFKLLRNLLEKLRSIAPDPSTVTELSMGMSGDFEEAIRAGSTMVRIGTAIFGSR
ncbi:YggS family pyridoxal phosphate-dependent enzyme [Prosthecochloris sp. N3]|uniref:Pyridoxal phosphate homeostasis protein n=1 Tax=Prosthecochloris ethylica TaxID=2743976 RepID=A0ABR9XTD9_9CHLB|nr:YggS family pyridoxal phosphate-dependent enzyme [Prosthecochloris ethylica]MBF0587188.1 YggS family pyridoxal phosphate-dependent enzyme [Prosthecochloris ethylica]MBF0637266.1 YggS family pyridoxal phosphate-dependent enzyme [Prosthecochloris ethylica]NUK48457.1 YggS family pyridoxal phosphate-dependent enzyme [Prosthecochloris ethylica]